MNGKKAKSLRRTARALTIGKPAVAYNDTVNPKRKVCGFTQTPNGVQVPYLVQTIHRTLKAGTTRHVYQALK